VQLFSGAVKPLEDLQHGEHGVTGSNFSSAFDPDTYRRLQRVADSGLLREGYEVWYKMHGGRQLEKELNSVFNRTTSGTPLYKYHSDRFSNTLRTAIKLTDMEDEPELLDFCKKIISDNGRIDVESFVELHRLICEVNGILHEPPTSSALRAAAARQLTHRNFTDLLAQQLPSNTVE
jgi:hypothetical protein